MRGKEKCPLLKVSLERGKRRISSSTREGFRPKEEILGVGGKVRGGGT